VGAVVLSDLHLGTVTRRDLLRRRDALDALAERVRGADHVVLLGDVLELREAPLAEALRDSELFFRTLGAAVGDAPVTIVPGNHDHRLAAPLVEAFRAEGTHDALATGASIAAPRNGPLGRIGAWLGAPELRLAYPGMWLRDDVYATHGHYLDCHVAIPTIERLVIAATTRALGQLGPGARSADDYEAAVEPIYDLAYVLAQTSHRGRRVTGTSRSTVVWQQLSRTHGGRRLGTRVLAQAVVPAAVAILNRAGVGPLTADLSGESLRRAGLRAMAEVLGNLGIDGAHVVFGHTHRSGPWPRDDFAEWQLPGGGRLTNTGSWVHEPAFLGDSPRASPYWPGTVVAVDDGQPPRLERVLETLPPA
jgi:predicted phosphodiesterase